jgi:hypothetical protein
MTYERIKGEPTANRLAIEALSHENHIVKNALRMQQYEQVGYVEAMEIAVLQLAAVNAEQMRTLVDRAAFAPVVRPAPMLKPGL